MPDNLPWTITHDFTHSWGGAEKCTEVLATHVLPNSSTWVISGNSEVTARMLPSSATKPPAMLFPMDTVSARIVRILTPALYPLIRMIPSTSNNILASSYALSHLRRTKSMKVIYCHSPFRQIYSGVKDYFPNNPLIQTLLSMALEPFRRIDRKAANEADVIIATNTIVADRIKEFWGRDVDAIIPPPIDTDTFHPVEAPERNYFVWAGRIVEPYKRVGLLVETLRHRPDLRLIVVGDGRDRSALESASTSNVTFVGKKSGTELSELIANAEALIFPSSDDFGMVPLEAMAAGTPVIGFSGGGARETVVDGTTGILFDEPTVGSLSEAIDKTRTIQWDYEAIRTYSLQYGQEGFVERVRDTLTDELFARKRA